MGEDHVFSVQPPQGGVGTILKSRKATVAFHMPTMKPSATGNIVQHRILQTTVIWGSDWNQGREWGVYVSL